MTSIGTQYPAIHVAEPIPAITIGPIKTPVTTPVEVPAEPVLVPAK